MSEKPTNRLINSSSPYLLQHAHNPVNWYPWSTEAFDDAKKRDVPVILSIGYSSCHWCHVMERESFENDEIAGMMNDKFVCIKVDREERPDIDQIYMEAIQTMGLNGGWPLNVFITKDQKPFYGGTYFPPAQWKQVCLGVSKAYQTNKDQLLESADQFFTEVNRSELSKYGIVSAEIKTDATTLKKIVNQIKNKFDPQLGGFARAPKFPMPNIWKFLLYANSTLKDEEIRIHLEKTLDGIAKGGIYDQIGGGFCRYSVDERWFAPHFEKMLYDNGQLISLYAEAYKVYPKNLYKEVVFDTISFLQREMMNKSGGFYSALDADSEGIEGKFYTWTSAELKKILQEDYFLFAEYYRVGNDGNWEGGRNILHIKDNPEEFAAKNQLDQKELRQKIVKWKAALMTRREKRIRPGLDDKVLAGWNGLVLKGLTDAYRTFREPLFLELAVKNAEFIQGHLIENGELKRTSGKEKIQAYLEDYAFVIDGLLGLYQCEFDEKWLSLAKSLCDKTIDLFYDRSEEMFFYTSSKSEDLIARKKEIFDNVVPASNSQTAINLLFLSKFFYDGDLEDLSGKMLSKMVKLVENEPSYLTNWTILYFYQLMGIAEINIMSDHVVDLARAVDEEPIFNKILAGTSAQSNLPALASRKKINDENTIYVCYNKTCKLPVHTVEEALKQIKIEPDRR